MLKNNINFNEIFSQPKKKKMSLVYKVANLSMFEINITHS